MGYRVYVYTLVYFVCPLLAPRACRAGALPGLVADFAPLPGGRYCRWRRANAGVGHSDAPTSRDPALGIGLSGRHSDDGGYRSYYWEGRESPARHRQYDSSVRLLDRHNSSDYR